MTVSENGFHQKLMDQAYARWQADQSVSQAKFWQTLNEEERFAVWTGNLNYQVCNGGFSQWWGNDYAQPEVVSYLIEQCAALGTPAASAVADLVRRFKLITGGLQESEISGDAWERIGNRMGDLDSAFYEVNDQFMLDAEAHLVKMLAAKPADPSLAVLEAALSWMGREPRKDDHEAYSRARGAVIDRIAALTPPKAAEVANV